MNLPFYVVTGDLAGDAPKSIMRLTQDWVRNAFPVLTVFYRGRGVEWFGGELPYLFDWMSRKRRVNPVPDLGRLPGSTSDTLDTYQLARDTDNHFYWLSTETVADRYTFAGKKGGLVVPARLQGTIQPGNKLRVYTIGVKDVTIWLSPGMVDFSKPVDVELRGLRDARVVKGKAPIQPDLELMMEDLYERADTRRPVLATIKLTP
jgi:hypothetical protein